MRRRVRRSLIEANRLYFLMLRAGTLAHLTHCLRGTSLSKAQSVENSHENLFEKNI
jgi:hypothetical protein